MATIKSFTDLPQSKVLAEFLPLESADMFYNPKPSNEIPYIGNANTALLQVPCWGLAALFGVLPYGTRLLKSTTDDTYHCDCPKGNIGKWFDNPIDACVEMILKLHEQKLL